MSTTILVVDDSESVRQQVSATLSEAGFETCEAGDGAEGVERVQAGGIDCVVCDVNMPFKNGIELVEELKQDPRFRDMPIIMLTTEGAQDLIGRAKAAGACGWIVKPFKPEMLKAAVKQLTGAVAS